MLVRKQLRATLGFSLIEIMIGLMIIGIGASLVVPRLIRRSPAIEWSALNQDLTDLLCFVRQEAIRTQKVHRLTFDKKKKTIVAEYRDGEEKPGVPRFVPAQSTYFSAFYEFPDQISFGRVSQGKKDLFEEHRGKAWCYVVPNGLVQDISVELVRDDHGQVQKKTFEAAPFLGVFTDTEENT